MLPEPTRYHPYRSSETSTPPHRTVSPSHHPFPTLAEPPGEKCGLVELCDEMAMDCVRRGVILFVTGRGFIKFAPPLIIEEEALREAVEVVTDVVDEML